MCPSDADKSLVEVQTAKAELARKLASQPGIVGIGIGQDQGRLVLKVNLRSAADGKRVPGVVQGVPVLTEVVGEIRAR